MLHAVGVACVCVVRFFEPWAIVCDAPAGVDSSETSMISD